MKKVRFVPEIIALTLVMTAVISQAATNPTGVITNSSGNAASVARLGVISPGPVAVRPFVDAEAILKSKLEIFVSDAENNVVDIYNINGRLLGQLGDLSEPQGITSDGKGNLYVADTANSRVQIYAVPYTKTPKTLNDPGQYPAGVAVLNDGEFAAVANIISTSGGPGSITLFHKGNAGPTITNSDFARVYFCGFDGNGNLYVDGENSSGAVEVGEIANVSKGRKVLKTLTYTGTIDFPGAVEVTTRGKIAIVDQEAATIFTYNPPVKGVLGSPIETTPLDGLSDPVTFAFIQNNKDLWTVDANGSPAANEFAYPAGGNPVKTVPINEGEPIGVAIVPAEIPGK